MIAYDDNDSARREEVLAVSRFEGAAIGTKTSGMNKQVLNLFIFNLFCPLIVYVCSNLYRDI